MLLFALNAVSHLIYNVFLVLHVQCFFKIDPMVQINEKNGQLWFYCNHIVLINAFYNRETAKSHMWCGL